jgi:hypothetical protein
VFERGSKHGTGLHSHSPTTPFPKDLLKPWGAQGSKTKKTSYSHGPSFTGGQSQGTSAEVKAPAAAPGSEGVAGQGTGKSASSTSLHSSFAFRILYNDAPHLLLLLQPVGVAVACSAGPLHRLSAALTFVCPC